MIRFVLLCIFFFGLITACGNPEKRLRFQNTVLPEQLFNTAWVAAGDNVSDEAGQSASATMIIFGMEENRIFGSGGCNRYSGAFEPGSGNSLRFQNIISTKMACPLMDQEADYFRKLNETRTYSFSEDFSELKLLDGAGETLITYERTAIRRT